MLGNQSELLPSARSIPQDTQQARSLWLNAFRAAHLLKGHHIAAADGSTALQAATRACDVPSLSGVSHIRHLYTPLSTIPIPKTGLQQSEIDLLRDLKRQGCCKESNTAFLLVCGDNVAESLAAITKT